MVQIKAKERDSLIQSLRAGVVPRVGLHLIQVGRKREIESFLRDLDRIASGGSAFRLVIGEYGSGKSFLLNLVRSIAAEKKLVTAHADLNPDRRLQASNGQAKSLYAELMRNMATRAKPEGGAVSNVVEKFVNSVIQDSKNTGHPVQTKLDDRLASLSELVGGYDFTAVIEAYWRGYDSGEDSLKHDAVRWLRAEFATKTDARKALGVRTIIDDDNFYDQLKLMARFIRLAGYSGFLVSLDEMVNLYKMHNRQARDSNYEQLLRILNDSLQGSTEGFGIILGGTPDFLTDTRRGLYSYSALQSRLSENRFAKNGLVDYNHPVLNLTRLSQEELYVLLKKLRYVFASGSDEQYLLPDEALRDFMEHCHKHVGEAYFQTPRNTIRSFVDLLSILEQNPGTDWLQALGLIPIAEDIDGFSDMVPSSSNEDEDDELVSFKL
jgi:hypothetical protein